MKPPGPAGGDRHCDTCQISDIAGHPPARRDNPCEGGELLEQVAQKDHGWPSPGNLHDQVGCSFEQPGLLEGAPAHGRVDLQGLFQPKFLYDSRIHPG